MCALSDNRAVEKPFLAMNFKFWCKKLDDDLNIA